MGFEQIRDYATKISLYLSYFYRLDNIKKRTLETILYFHNRSNAVAQVQTNQIFY